MIRYPLGRRERLFSRGKDPRPRMPGKHPRELADPELIKPGDIVWLDARHLTPTRGVGGRTWPHNAICLYHYYNDRIPNLIVSGTIFQFVCISSLTRNNPFNPETQVLLDHHDPNMGLMHPSVACVDFAPSVEVSVEGQRHVLEGVRRLTTPVVHTVPTSPTLQAILTLFQRYWSAQARSASERKSGEQDG